MTAAQATPRAWDMSEQELYMFDTMGFLRVRNMLSPEQVAAALASAKEGIDSGALDHTSMAPKGEHVGGDFYVNAFLYSKVIERISYTPKLLDYACHVLNNQPRLSEQILMCQDETHRMHNFHLRKDSPVQIKEDGPRFYTDSVNRRVYMDHVSFFVYLTDVKDGDGGLCCVPGSHKSAFTYPGGMFYNLGADGDNHGPTDDGERKKLGFVQVTANAGDCIIMPLRLNHAVMPWLPTDRQRVVLFFTFIPYVRAVTWFCISF